MNILALDTSSDACSCALLCKNELIEKFEVAPREHANILLNMFDSLLAETGLSKSAISGISFGRGPGAFTGVRIATAVTQGLAYALDVPVVAVSSLQAMAQSVYRLHQHDKVLTAFDARMHEVYWGAFEVDMHGLMQPLIDEQVCAPGKVEMPDSDNWIGAGHGWVSYEEELMLQASGKCRLNLGVSWPHAQDILRLSMPYHQTGQTLTARQAVPVYLRDKVVQS